MIYLIEINNGKIIGKGRRNNKLLKDNEVEVTKAIFDSIIKMPADFTEEEGIIISVSCPQMKNKIISERPNDVIAALCEAVIDLSSRLEVLEVEKDGTVEV